MADKYIEYDYLIVGAGLFGATCANLLTKAGKKCLVIEKESHVGGAAYTQEVEGIMVHKFGPHIFHTDNEKVWKYVNKFAKFNRFTNCPLAKFEDEVYNLPINMNTFYKLWDVTNPNQARMMVEAQIRDYLIKFEKENPNRFKKGKKFQADNLEEQAILMFGTDIYEKIIKGYTIKQWGKKPTKLPPEIIQRMTIRYDYNNDYYDNMYQGVPIGGYTAMIEKMLKGVEVCLDTDYFKNRQMFDTKAYKIIFSGMIDEFYDNCYGKLEYRTLRFEEEVLGVVDYQGNAIVNYTSEDVPYTRIVEHKYFEAQKYRDECTYVFDDELYKGSSKPLNTVITREYPQSYIKGMPPLYPIKDRYNDGVRKLYIDKSKKEDRVFLGGRLGSYMYYNMDQVVEEAIKLVASLLSKK